MASLPPALDNLVNELSRLPTIGRRSAERLAFHLLRVELEDARALSAAIVEMRRKITFCIRCFNIAEGELCPVCLDARRDGRVVCVVEDARDVLVFENSGFYHGSYHVLGGCLSPMKGVMPENLHISQLMRRIDKEAFQELILATSPSVDGDATALYLSNLVADRVSRVTRIGLGVPVGSSLDNTDAVTIQKSLEGRRAMR